MEHLGILAFLNKELRFSQPALPNPSRFIISSQLSCFSRFLKGKSNRSLARQCMSVADVNSHYITTGGKHLCVTGLRHQSEYYLCWKYFCNPVELLFYYTTVFAVTRISSLGFKNNWASLCRIGRGNSTCASFPLKVDIACAYVTKVDISCFTCALFVLCVTRG